MTILISILGSVLLIATWLKIEKDKRDKHPNKVTISWREYAQRNWDDWLFAILIGAVLGIVQEDFYGVIVHWREWDYDKAWTAYYDSEYFISLCLGFFGELIIKTGHSAGSKVINKLMK